jgi:flagellar hook protein FlgE
MALIRALNSSISGLRSHQFRIDTIGNNLANVNTVAFKSSRTLFQTQLSQVLDYGTAATAVTGGINPRQIGLGVDVGAISEDFSQGSLDRTGISSDLAIEGDGFFVLHDPNGAPVYSRDGSFRRNINNQLVNPANGFRVQGWQATYITNTTTGDFTIDTGGSLTDISAPVGELAIAQETDQVNIAGNLNPDAVQAVNGTMTRSALLYNTAGGAGTLAGSATLLTNLSTSSTAVAGDAAFAAGQRITVTARKGGRQLPSSTFTVLASGSGPDSGSTVQHFIDWLQQKVGINDQAFSGSTSPGTFGTSYRNGSSAFSGTTSGAAAIAGSSVTITELDGSVNLTTLDDGVQVGDVVRFTTGSNAGAAGRVTAVGASTLTLADLQIPGSSTLPASTIAAGTKYTVHRRADITMRTTSAGANTGEIEIVGNLGTANRIENIVVTAGSGSSLFSFTQGVAADGNSTHTSFVAYDSLGSAHTVDLTMVEEHNADSQTVWRYYADAIDDTSGGLNIGTGVIAFNTNGQYSSTSPTNNQFAMDLNAMGVATQLIFSADFSPITQLSNGPSTINLRSQDGFARGVLETFSIGADGVVSGIFSNGLKRSLAQVALARFSNNNGMLHLGDNVYQIGPNSGAAQVGVAGTDGRGTIIGGALEESNVELSREFTDLIITQRGFQANARIISVADEMLNELVNLRR